MTWDHRLFPQFLRSKHHWLECNVGTVLPVWSIPIAVRRSSPCRPHIPNLVTPTALKQEYRASVLLWIMKIITTNDSDRSDDLSVKSRMHPYPRARTNCMVFCVFGDYVFFCSLAVIFKIFHDPLILLENICSYCYRHGHNPVPVYNTTSSFSRSLWKVKWFSSVILVTPLWTEQRGRS